MRACRFAWVVTHPIQYQAPVFRELARMEELDPTVLFLSDHGTRPSFDPQFGKVIQFDVPLLEGYRHQFVGGTNSANVSEFGLRAAGLRRVLRDGNWDAVVVSGYARVGYLEAIAYAHWLGVPVVHLSETTLEERPRPAALRAAKALLFSTIFRPHDHGLAVGTRSRRYLERAGVRPDHIHSYPYTTDTTLTDAAWTKRDQLRSERRIELNLRDDDVVFLFVGKLMPKKDPVGLARAFKRADVPAHLVYVGTGELEQQLRSEVGDDPRVHILGFRNQSELPSWYAAADAIVLPSSEPWGLVVNEAMAMGCAVVVGDRVGSAEDLVLGRETGVVAPTGDVDALGSALRALALDRERLARYRSRVRDVVAAHSPRRAAEGVREAVLAAAAGRER